jgi:hypothetical protein
MEHGRHRGGDECEMRDKVTLAGTCGGGGGKRSRGEI